MNEQTISQDRLAKEIDTLLAPYPDPWHFSTDQAWSDTGIHFPHRAAGYPQGPAESDRIGENKIHPAPASGLHLR